MTGTRAPALLTVYHRADDPWSYLLLQALPALHRVYDVRFRFVTVPRAGQEYLPRPEATMENALRDAADLSRHLDLRFPDPAVTPEAAAAEEMQRLLLSREDAESYLAAALAAGDALFSGRRGPVERLLKQIALPEPEAAEAALAANLAEQIAAGHYLSGMIHFEGGWYWGVDRLFHLETVLINRGFRRGTGVPGVVRARTVPHLRQPMLPPEADGGEPVLRFYCSFRSPYSWLAAERTFDLARRFRVRVEPRLIIPMKMAGFAIPKIKADYFRTDCAREALRHGVPFGRFTDPFGEGLMRAMAVVPLAAAEGRLEPYILATMRGVWAGGRDLAVDGDLRAIFAEAGLDPEAALAAADAGADLAWADRHREELAAWHQYAAPTFVIGDYMTWGQDRLWILERVLEAAAGRR